MPKKVKFRDLGLIDYKKAWDIQENIHKKVVEQKLSVQKKKVNYEEIIFCEHPHVYTLGKSGMENNLLINENFLKSISATFYKINRGGDITYHGPGQIVGYPIIDIQDLGFSVKEYIGILEDVIIKTLFYFNIEATRMPHATGVWLEPDSNNPRKICAIGVRISRYVTMHGFALNINTDLNYFNYINPCGFTDKGITSVEKEISQKVELDKVKTILKRNLARLLNVQLAE